MVGDVSFQLPCNALQGGDIPALAPPMHLVRHPQKKQKGTVTARRWGVIPEISVLLHQFPCARESQTERGSEIRYDWPGLRKS
mmetsp:Transcript_14434/g.29065  ORF Transcript_14434/g.29065 Transcript_14434/m.29065 type:complete len:83 (-) Transcript_14434:229-477(-)